MATGPITYFALILIFVVIWAAGLGTVISFGGNLAIEQGNLSGIEAFLWANLNLVIFIAVLLGIFLFMQFGAG